MKIFRTVVEPEAFPVKMNYKTPSLFIGSCFTHSIGSYFKEMKFPVKVNPFGTMYNPLSVGATLERLLEGRPFSREELNKENGLWFSFLHDTSFSGTDPERVLENINNRLAQGKEQLQKAKFLFLTFGTARVYEWKKEGRIVSNCHKLPAKLFRHRLLSVEEIASRYVSILERLYRVNPDLQVVFTVSPVRHWKDGAHGNQVSKSVLFVAINQLMDRFPNSGYFPAYEIVMDDLRDYRFYAEDMLHLRDEAVDYIREKFQKVLIDPVALPVMKEIQKIKKAMHHKPFRPDSTDFQKFIAQQREKISTLNEKYPFLGLSEEIEFWEKRGYKT